jgi:hypothetical protein
VNYHDKRYLCSCHCGLLSPPRPLPPLHRFSSEADFANPLFSPAPPLDMAWVKRAIVLYRFFFSTTAPARPPQEETRSSGPGAVPGKNVAFQTRQHDIFGALSWHFRGMLLRKAYAMIRAGRDSGGNVGTSRGTVASGKCWARWRQQGGYRVVREEQFMRACSQHKRLHGTGYAFPDNVRFLVNLPHRESFNPDAAWYTGVSQGAIFLTVPHLCR